MILEDSLETAPLPRYTRRPFPPYRYVPGKTPHPVRDPAGHSFNRPPEQPPEFNPEDWRSCEQYLYGIDLFNHGYWWEAHEALEAVWIAAGRKSGTGLFIQGLIQVAVAHLKKHQGFGDTAQRMAKEGLDKMKHCRSPRLGIELDVFRSAVTLYFSGKRATPVRIRLADLD